LTFLSARSLRFWDSLWALLVAVPLCGVIVVRLLDEEWYLSAHLPGYDVYCQKAHVDRGDLA
jgi:protein-S-isoprenylcysteine O-methyltransferase Ste14